MLNVFEMELSQEQKVLSVKAVLDSSETLYSKCC